MTNLIKQGSSLIVKTDEQFPWGSGKITLPMNSVFYVLDESDAVVFKSVANGDILFQTLLGNLTINGTPATKDNIINLFDAVSNAATGGGGGGGAVDSVNGKTGAVVITANDLDAYTKEEVNGLIPDVTGYATEQWVGEQGYLTAVPDTYVTDDELNSKNYATKDELPDISVKQDKLIGTEVEGQNLKTINGQSLLGTGNIEITAGGGQGGAVDSVNGQTGNVVISAKDLNVYTIPEIDGKGYLTSIPDEYITETELNSKNYATKDELPSLAGYATEQWVGEQGYLTNIPENYVTDEELTAKDYATVDQLKFKQDVLNGTQTIGQNIKMLNSETLLGVGNIEISPATLNVPTNEEMNQAIGVKQDKLVGEVGEGQNIKTINGETILGTGNIEIQGETAGLKEVTLTQQEYDQLVEKDPNTMYIISDYYQFSDSVAVVGSGDNIQELLARNKVITYADENKNLVFSSFVDGYGYAFSNDKMYEMDNSGIVRGTDIYLQPEVFDATELFTASQTPESTVSIAFKNQIRTAINSKKVLHIHTADVNVVLTFAKIEGDYITFSATDNKINYEFKLNWRDGKVTATTNTISDYVKRVNLTQQEYDLLVEKDPNALYFITDAQ